MSRAAVPAYLGEDFREAAPGHRFALYLSVWDQQWKKQRGGAIEELLKLNDDDRKRLGALIERQRRLLQHEESAQPGSTLNLPATSTSPFTTGLGMAHPLENGFAFLTPYGLPYLAGSGVKGVLRQAARELAEGGEFEDPGRDWDWPEIEALFGSPGEDEGGVTGRRRGALNFWDVFPEPGRGQDLAWEVMTPHQGSYYQDATGQTAPHDNGAPVPIYFLGIPAGSGFRFHIQCNRALLRQTGPTLLEPAGEDGDRARWQVLLETLFAHAFEWLGFGAKTAVGYGALSIDEKTRRHEAEAREKIRAEQARKEQLASLPPGQRRAEELLEQRQDPSYPAHRFLLEQLEAGAVAAEEQAALAQVALDYLAQDREKVRKTKKAKQKLPKLDEEEVQLQRFVDEEGTG
ncbi:type III-B CRISPR module RAMP protein Cmr6 [Halorhodospira halophila]|uniref:CRISPR-associated protein, Cmr6 family n=1 Tax=Halorhodospira halophila (strain DSM 244 / SL1) TaxID=349124 RepID=A1WUQ4_HALHL|nr:type III-B CRISPR module RAMP protein Cmr6 [Halorhodospira halophila]ABM61416.1 CRISPR-associated protein, Cmr6 family [Halorhodospira halophila SL1]MBK1728658.1 type III-B CRISPR module RAMP protein Cmr6 [Halorhodospira halophila]